MNRRKLGLAKLSLCLIIALGAISVAAASAPAAAFDENGSALTNTKAFKGVLPATGDFRFLIPLQSLQIRCGFMVTEDGLFFNNAEGRVTLTMSSCATFLKGVFLEPCDPGKIKITAIVKPISAEGEVQLLFSPTAGGIFGYIEFEDEACPLAHASPIKGSFVDECTGKVACNTSAIIHPITQNWALDELKYGSQVMYIEATLELELVNGSPFAALAP
jgi:hypothetical protein